MADNQVAVAVSEVQQEQDSKPKRRHAPRYRVFVHNDDRTPADFVVEMLVAKFHKANTQAMVIMLEAHKTGIAYVDTLPLEQAEFRVDQVHSLARGRKFPLKLTYEPEE